MTSFQIQISTLHRNFITNNLNFTQPVHRHHWLQSFQPPCFQTCMRTIQSWTEIDMETIILNYNNLWFNLNTMVDWIPLRLTITAMRSDGWIHQKLNRKCVGGNHGKEKWNTRERKSEIHCLRRKKQGKGGRGVAWRVTGILLLLMLIWNISKGRAKMGVTLNLAGSQIIWSQIKSKFLTPSHNSDFTERLLKTWSLIIYHLSHCRYLSGGPGPTVTVPVQWTPGRWVVSKHCFVTHEFRGSSFWLKSGTANISSSLE